MSKQPRSNVRIGAGNTAGARVSNIFVDVEKFLTKFQEAREKASKQSKVSLICNVVATKVDFIMLNLQNLYFSE